MYADRYDAGNRLGQRLSDEPLIQQAEKKELLVLSIPRGGVMVGAAVANILGCAHDVVIVKKIGFPGQAELALGAVAEDGIEIIDRRLLTYLRQVGNYIKQAVDRKKMQIAADVEKYRLGRVLDLQNKVVVLVDDGIATGETMKAAIQWVTADDRPDRPRRVVVAVPVSSPRTAVEISKLVDAFVCLDTPQQFWAVGQFYRDFGQVSEEVVLHLLQKSTASPA